MCYEFWIFFKYFQSDFPSKTSNIVTYPPLTWQKQMVSKLEEGKKAGYIVQEQNRMTTIFNGGKLVFFPFFSCDLNLSNGPATRQLCDLAGQRNIVVLA
jgi:hypothetical protein